MPGAIREQIPAANDLKGEPLSYNLRDLGAETRVTAVYLGGSIDVLYLPVDWSDCETPSNRNTGYVVERFVEVADMDVGGDGGGATSSQCVKLTVRFSAGVKSALELLRGLELKVHIQPEYRAGVAKPYRRVVQETLATYDAEYFGLASPRANQGDQGT